MTIKNIALSATVIAAGFITINATFKGEPKDALDKRIFTTSISELKENAPAKKGVADEIEFKGGKMFSLILEEKLGLKWTNYEIKKDSTFMDEENNEVHWVEGEVSTTDDADQTTVMTFTVEDYDIRGEVKVTKKDKLKKRYEFAGKEKEKKKKK